MRRTFAHWPTKVWGPFSNFVSIVDGVIVIVVVHMGNYIEVLAGDLHGVVVVAFDIQLESYRAEGATSQTCAVACVPDGFVAIRTDKRYKTESMGNVLVGKHAGVLKKLYEVDGFETVGDTSWTCRS